LRERVAIFQATMPALHRRAADCPSRFDGGTSGIHFMSAYIATKFALEGLCDVMRREAAPQGVKVSLIQRWIRTNMVHQQITDARRDIAALDEKNRGL